MCGRFTLRTSRARLGEAFELEPPSWLVPRFNIAPSQPIAVIREHAGRREWAELRWGLVPFWAKADAPQYSTINARAETVADKPAFRKPFRQQRCLIPADGFYEWTGAGKVRQPYYIHCHDDAPFAFAGLWDRCEQDGMVIESATVIVTEANATLRPIHDRMPVILPPQHYSLWLDHRKFDRQQLLAALVPCSDDLLSAYPVSREVNTASRDDPACIDPVADLFD